MTTKTPSGSFEPNRKEPFSERLNELLEGRSLYRAAKDWDVNFSTLKNYYARPDSSPRKDVVSKIAQAEGVSAEWLLGMDSNEPQSLREPRQVYQPNTMQNEATMSAIKLAEMLSVLGNEGVDALIRLFTLKGVETLLQLLDERNLKLLQLPDSDKDRLLAILENSSKKGTSEIGSGVTEPDPEATSKKVG